jgi:hypothetical protein
MQLRAGASWKRRGCWGRRWSGCRGRCWRGCGCGCGCWSGYRRGRRKRWCRRWRCRDGEWNCERHDRRQRNRRQRDVGELRRRRRSTAAAEFRQVPPRRQNEAAGDPTGRGAGSSAYVSPVLGRKVCPRALRRIWGRPDWAASRFPAQLVPLARLISTRLPAKIVRAQSGRGGKP